MATIKNKDEYTRTDAFIEKACEWLSKHFYDDVYEIRDDEGTWIDADLLIEDFEKYILKSKIWKRLKVTHR